MASRTRGRVAGRRGPTWTRTGAGGDRDHDVVLPAAQAAVLDQRSRRSSLRGRLRLTRVGWSSRGHDRAMPIPTRSFAHIRLTVTDIDRSRNLRDSDRQVVVYAAAGWSVVMPR